MAGEKSLPFKPWKPESYTRGLNVSPIEERSMSIMEYYETPGINLKGIIGLSYAREQVISALRSGTRTMLIIGPPGTGKSVLALAIATELGRKIIDVDLSKLSPREENLLRDMINYIAGKQYTVILYNLDSYLYRNSIKDKERIIIYDPYTDYSIRSISQRVIIYDPYTDQEQIVSSGTRLENMLRELREASSYLIATTSMTWILPPGIRELFDTRIRIRLPDIGERLEILSQLVGSETRSKYDMNLLAYLSRGCNVQDLKRLAELLVEGRKLEDIMKDFRCYAERFTESMHI